MILKMAEKATRKKAKMKMNSFERFNIGKRHRCDRGCQEFIWIYISNVPGRLNPYRDKDDVDVISLWDVPLC